MTVNAGRTSVQQEARATHRITQTVPIFRSNSALISLMHWISRTSFRRCILQELYSMDSSERNFRTGKQQHLWYARSQRTTDTISPTYSVCKEHGYLSGEHFTCPKCGKKAEVYSRITGYYRPVQNWNDGKAQEYKNRTLYDVMHSSLKKVHTSMVTVTEDDVKVEPVETHKYLFTTSTCPNCRMAKKMLEGEDLEIIDAEKNPDMARQFGIMQAPTLVITDGEHLKKYVNASNIQKYVDEELD